MTVETRKCYSVGCTGTFRELPTFSGVQCDECGRLLTYGLFRLSDEALRNMLEHTANDNGKPEP